MTSLITSHDLEPLHGPSRLGVGPDAWTEMARRAIVESALWMERFVPQATLAEAKADILAGTADSVQESLRQAQLHYAIYLMYVDASGPLGAPTSIRVGDVALSQASVSGVKPVALEYKQRAIRYLQRAGYAWEVAGGV